MWKKRDEGLVRDAIYQRWNSNTESMGDGTRSAMELGISGSGVGLEVRS